ncbi:hypothetical protein [Roseateles asaccharophilus]|uniref:Uncharacterized protein n=1 Tax=Roseateles asaccharophilus TaxID=582607 RepID=A0ABU2ABF9_9BURK|nr:hypothetical protein [Roseateles asaccharophilus]MDR7334509.1 hypothetical protein [Roseateles asaccharophilus]
MTAKVPASGKVLKDLAELLQAVRKSLPSAKPWQRQLRAYLSESDRWAQVLHMAVALERDPVQVAEAAAMLRMQLRAANNYVAMGRADMGTKAAVLLAFELGNKAADLLAG